MKKYILAVDQSTQGTKGLLFDEAGQLVARADHPHRQIINELGWVEHDPEEILCNTIGACNDTVKKAGIDPALIAAVGISNQRETSVAWDRVTGRPAANAIVWQCARAAGICERHREEAGEIRLKTGLALSPYFPASKMQWIMENVPQAQRLAEEDRLCMGTFDSWLVYNLTREKNFKTDYSNASRTQLFNIRTLTWDKELLASFQVPESAMPEVCMSDSVFGTTDLSGLLPAPVPVCGVLGDSHGALFGQNCRRAGQLKATYGTGSSVMMNIGEEMKLSDGGLVTSLAWGMNGKVEYVFEGNLNYTGAVITWLKDEMHLIDDAAETGAIAEHASRDDRAYFVPAFTGLGSPYWDSEATGMFTGITRTTGRKEMVKACMECIAYQITDLIELMASDAGQPITAVRVDGGPTANRYLMQFQSDIAQASVEIPDLQELSGMGAAYTAGIAMGLYDPETIFKHIKYSSFEPAMAPELRDAKYKGWKAAVKQVLAHE